MYVREIVIESRGLALIQPDIHPDIDGSVLTLQATRGCSTSLLCAYSSQKSRCGGHSLPLDPTPYASLAWRGQPSTIPMKVYHHLPECRERGEKCLQTLKSACECLRRLRQEAAELVLCPLVMEGILLGPLRAVEHGAKCWMMKRRGRIGAGPALHSAHSSTTLADCTRDDYQISEIFCTTKRRLLTGGHRSSCSDVVPVQSLCVTWPSVDGTWHDL